MTTISERGGATLPTISRNLILLPQNRVNGNQSGPSGPGSQHIALRIKYLSRAKMLQPGYLQTFHLLFCLAWMHMKKAKTQKRKLRTWPYAENDWPPC